MPLQLPTPSMSPASVKAHAQSSIEVLGPGETKPGIGGAYWGLK